MATRNNLIIVDSSGLISLVVDSDSNHGKAVAIANQFVDTEDKALVPAEVFAETLNILGKKFGHEYAAGTVQAVVQMSTVRKRSSGSISSSQMRVTTDSSQRLSELHERATLNRRAVPAGQHR